MKKEEFSYPSSDGKTAIHAIRWIPEEGPKAVLQIVHGMTEYVDRYDRFARFLADNGFLVVGNDHLGHGQSVTAEDRLGFFAEEDGNKKVLSDIHRLHEITAAAYSDKPYFMLGHSMGSFLCRQYAAEHGNTLSGAIIMGTGMQPAAVTAFGKELCRLIAGRKGWDHRSGMVDRIATGSYNKKFEGNTGYEWLSTDREHVAKYAKDPLCTYMFTVNGYYNMFDSIYKLAGKSYVEGMPKDLPVLFVSGADDPVGDYGKAVQKVYDSFRKMGMKDVALILYPGDRHEILSEKDKETVDRDILSWMNARM